MCAKRAKELQLAAQLRYTQLKACNSAQKEPVDVELPGRIVTFAFSIKAFSQHFAHFVFVWNFHFSSCSLNISGTAKQN